MLAAVLARRAGLALGDQDIHLNVAGGFRVSDPGSDLAVCAALASSFLDREIPAHTILFGEVGLGGEVREVKRPALRLREAKTLGFTRAVGPLGATGEDGIEVQHVATVAAMLDRLV
jgi:DNA repair protein RadA/Sms